MFLTPLENCDKYNYSFYIFLSWILVTEETLNMQIVSSLRRQVTKDVEERTLKP